MWGDKWLYEWKNGKKACQVVVNGVRATIIVIWGEVQTY